MTLDGSLFITGAIGLLAFVAIGFVFPEARHQVKWAVLAGICACIGMAAWCQLLASPWK